MRRHGPAVPLAYAKGGQAAADTRPEILDPKLVWDPGTGVAPIRIDVADYFGEVLGQAAEIWRFVTVLKADLRTTPPGTPAA